MTRLRTGSAPATKAIGLSGAGSTTTGLGYSGLTSPFTRAIGSESTAGATAAASALVSGSGGVTPVTPQELARLLRHGRAMLDDPRVRAYVLGLQGCLTEISPRLRGVLRLRVGLTEPRRSARAVAARLHISRKRLRVLEVRAVRDLANAARTTACATPVPVPPTPPFALVGFVGSLGGGAAGGVAGGLYFKEPAEAGAESVPPAEAVPGPTLRVTKDDDAPLIWALGAVILGSLLVTYLVRSDMGLGAPAFVRRRRHRVGRPERPDRSEGSDGN